MVLSIKYNKIKKIAILIFTLFLLIFLCKQVVNYILPIKYCDLIEKYSKEYNIDKTLLFSVINAESRFKKDAKSHKGAIGLMQIMPKTGIWLTEKMNIEKIDEDELYIASVNIKIGSFYLRYLLDKYQDETLALCAYNAGSANVYKWLADNKYSTDGNLHTIPFNETKKYVKKIKTFKIGYDILLKIHKIFNK